MSVYFRKKSSKPTPILMRDMTSGQFGITRTGCDGKETDVGAGRLVFRSCGGCVIIAVAEDDLDPSIVGNIYDLDCTYEVEIVDPAQIIFEIEVQPNL